MDKKLLLIWVMVALILYGGVFCSRIDVKKNGTLHLSESDNQILVVGENYRLLLIKQEGFAYLENRHGVRYTSFPLYAQLSSNSYASSMTQYNWKLKGKEINIEIKYEGRTTQKVMIKPSINAFEIKFAVQFIGTDRGVYLFKRGTENFESDKWENCFSPEPDNLFSFKPQVDVRVDRDQQWAFAPAPLNLSFKMKAGWFSVGLAELPQATIFALKDHAIYMDYPWHKVHRTADGFYWLEPVVFTFNDSPWDAVGDYQEYLETHQYIEESVAEERDRPAWWSNPLVSTWGEQTMQEATYDSPEFNSTWVKNYILNQEIALNCKNFTVVIEDKWSAAYGDPTVDNRFKDLRQLIDWCHERGHKVILWWKAWKVEAKSLAVDYDVVDGEIIDATHSQFEAYMDTCCQILLGDGEGQYNADGIKIDYLFLVRNPMSANYANPEVGVGIKELFHYLDILYRCAKIYKPDCLISTSAVDPHFANVQDMVRIHNDWDNKLRREKRARIISRALPSKLIDGEAVDMYNSIALYHYATSAIYGVPSIGYLSRFHDGEITEQTKRIIADILNLSSQKSPGRLEFIDYGNWRIVKNNNIIAETLPLGKGIVVYSNDQSGTLLCTENTSVHLLLNRRLLRSVIDANGNEMEFIHRGQGIYELSNVQLGGLYKLSLKKILNVYE